MANITVTEAASAIPTIVAAKALGHLKANTVLARVVNRDWDENVAKYGQTVVINKRGGLSVNDKAANTVVTLQTPSTTGINVTLNKHKEVSFMIEDIAKMVTRPDLLMGYMEDSVAVIGEQIDSDIAGLYAGFSQTIDATGAAGPIAAADFIEASRLLNAAKAPLTNRWAVLHEDAHAEAEGIEQIINRDYKGDAAMQAVANGWLGKFKTFNIVMDQKIRVATGVCKNLFLHRDAAVLATRPMERVPAGLGVYQDTLNEDGLGLRVTLAYNPSYLAWQCTIDVLYGVAELRDDHGVVVSTTEK